MPTRRIAPMRATKRAKVKSDPGSLTQSDDNLDQSVILETKDELSARTIECTAGLDGQVASFEKKRGGFVQKLEFFSDKPYSLKSVLMKTGAYQGRHVIVLDPYPTEDEMFPFLKLPPEIRNIIYSLVLERPGYTMGIGGKHAGKVRVEHWRNDNGLWISASRVGYNISLMLASRQTYAESSSCLFGRHLLEFADSTMLKRFLEYVGPERAQSLIKIDIRHMYITSAKWALRLLSTATSLESLKLGSYRMRLSCAGAADFIFPIARAMCASGRKREDIFGVFEFRGVLTGVCCDTHGSYVWMHTKVDCPQLALRQKQWHECFAEKLGELLDVDEKKEPKKKASVKGSTKTRAGRETKSIDYAEDSDEDCVD